jgi:DNA-binding SARP family transcriptional activator
MTPEDALDPDVEAWVRVLGPVDTIGWAETARPRQIELVAYLATQSAAAVPADRLNAALWPNGIDPAGQRAAASRARKALGQSEATGDERFPRAVPENPTYRLHATVSSDWALGQRHLAAASAAESADDETNHLVHALALVRGEPFSGVPKDTYGWAHTEHVIYEIEVALTDAAHRLGELALAAGDWATARWAARQGLRVSPWQEAMFRLEMRARAGAGDIDGVHRAWRATVDAARIEDPGSTPQPETCALYDQLIHQSRSAAGA